MESKDGSEESVNLGDLRPRISRHLRVRAEGRGDVERSESGGSRDGDWEVWQGNDQTGLILCHQSLKLRPQCDPILGDWSAHRDLFSELDGVEGVDVLSVLLF